MSGTFDPARTGFRDQVGHMLTYAESVMNDPQASPGDRQMAQRVWRQGKGLHRLFDRWRCETARPPASVPARR